VDASTDSPPPLSNPSPSVEEGPAEGTGERAVVFEYCISCVFLTYRGVSRVHVLKPDQWTWPRALPYMLATLLLGWWGVPWGLICTPRALWIDLTGGRPPTEEEAT
jgi:hypothetical protein